MVASGFSLSRRQCHLTMAARDAGRCRVIVVNDNWKRVWNADILFAADASWWRQEGRHVPADYRAERWSVDTEAAEFGCRIVGSFGGLGLMENHLGPQIRRGHSSGFMAIQMALRRRSSKVLLIGFDCMDGPSGQKHWFGQHRGALKRSQPFDVWIQDYMYMGRDCAQRGLRVINCSERTAIDAFPRSDLEAELE